MRKLQAIVLLLFCACMLRAQNCTLSFLKQDLNTPMRDYCEAIRKDGFTIVGEVDNCMVYRGQVLGIPNVDLMVYSMSNGQAIETVAFVFPKGPHWAGVSDYEKFRSHFTEIYGSPSAEGDEDGEPKTAWKFEKVYFVVMLTDEQKVMLIWGNREEPAETPAPTASASQQEEKADEADDESALYNQASLAEHQRLYKKTGDRKELLYMAAFAEKLGSIYINKGWHSTAMDYYTQCLKYIEQYSGKRSADYVATVFNVAVACAGVGDMGRATQYADETLRYMGHVFDKEPRKYIVILRGVALTYNYAGKYAQAEALYDRILQELPQKLSGKERNVMLQIVYHDLGSLAMQLGDMRKARNCLDRELEVIRQIGPEPDEVYALNYVGYGVLEIESKNYAQAVEMLRKALYNLPNQTTLENKIYAAGIYDNMSIAYAYMDQPDEAIPYSLKAVELYAQTYSKDHQKYANATNNLAFAYYKKKDYAHALQYAREALDVFERALGKEHSDVMMAAYNVGGYSYNTGRYDDAERYFRQSVCVAKTNYRQALDYMSEYQREQFWKKCHVLMEFPEMAQFIYYNASRRPSVAEFAYDNELFSKGLLLASRDMVRRSIEESGNAQLKAQYAQLSSLKEQIGYMEQSGKTTTLLDSCRQAADALEKEVTKQSAAFRQNEALWQMSWRDVQRQLRPKQIAIEFARIPVSEDSIMYAALAVRKEDTAPRLIPLFEEKEVSTLLQSTTPDEQYDYTQSGSRLYRAVWAKILPYLHYGDTVYCAATGVLHQVAIETLPFNEERAIGSMFHIVRLSSTRELAMRHGATKQASAVLYGGIYYDMDMDDLLAQSESYAGSALAVNRAVTDESLRAGVHYLPGTKQEVEAIGSILRPSNVKTQVFSAGAANEESFKALSGKHTNILHIATHGFYWTDEAARSQRYFSQRSASLESLAGGIDPLTRSGLLLAGANIALRGHSAELPANVQDGILTSKEISLLDLRDAEMVVLSACETGKGEITGEGVFGLQRAFKMAGAQTILMSLWPVDDAATQLMMSAFYRYWIGMGKNKREAFRQAQAEVRQQYPQPSYWAAFILLD